MASPEHSPIVPKIPETLLTGRLEKRGKPPMLNIKIKFQNGITFEKGLAEILHEVTDTFDFVESDQPDFIIFGPYGNEIPTYSEKYQRIGYFCENVIPDLSICEWAFGVPHENKIKSPRYKRIQWHGFDPSVLVKNLTDEDIDEIIRQKTRFCNFLYSHSVPYREAFFKKLSKYKKIDAPGKCMNNMQPIDRLYTGNMWERKRQFLSSYKFTIAFENYSYPGYQTEKLYDAMQVNSIPIYFGDPLIDQVFDSTSFINVCDYVSVKDSYYIQLLERFSQMDFDDIRPQFFNSPFFRVKRKLKSLGRELKMKLQLNYQGMSDVIDKIIEIDKKPDLYVKYLKSPWLLENQVPDHLSTRNRWIEIFTGIRSSSTNICAEKVVK